MIAMEQGRPGDSKKIASLNPIERLADPVTDFTRKDLALFKQKVPFLLQMIDELYNHRNGQFLAKYKPFTFFIGLMVESFIFSKPKPQCSLNYRPELEVVSDEDKIGLLQHLKSLQLSVTRDKEYDVYFKLAETLYRLTYEQVIDPIKELDRIKTYGDADRCLRFVLTAFNHFRLTQIIEGFPK